MSASGSLGLSGWPLGSVSVGSSSSLLLNESAVAMSRCIRIMVMPMAFPVAAMQRPLNCDVLYARPSYSFCPNVVLLACETACPPKRVIPLARSAARCARICSRCAGFAIRRRGSHRGFCSSQASVSGVKPSMRSSGMSVLYWNQK